jgi:hypothetical protein
MLDYLTLVIYLLSNVMDVTHRKENISPKKPQLIQAHVKSFCKAFEGLRIKGAFGNVSIFFYPRMTHRRPFLSLDPTRMTLAFLIIMDRNLPKSAPPYPKAKHSTMCS